VNAILRDGPAGGVAVEVPQPPPPTLSVEVRPEVPEGPVQPGDEFPTVGGPTYAYRLAPVPMVGTYVNNDPKTAMWTTFYVYDKDAQAELADQSLSVHELELDAGRDWDIIDGPTQVDPEGRDASMFRYRYRREAAEKNVAVVLSGSAMASVEGLEVHIAEIVWSRGAAALIKSLRDGKMPDSITVFSDGRIIESP
jgi:hypothetical protein